MSKRVAVFPGQATAPAVVEPTVDLLRDMRVDIEFTIPPVEEYRDELAADKIPADIERSITDSDATLFGAAHGDGDTYIKILTYLRTEYDGGLPANIRPSKYFEGANSPLADPSEIDYMIVRENTASPFNRNEGIEGDLDDLKDLTEEIDSEDVLGKDFTRAGDGTFAIQVTSVENVRLTARKACEIALDRFDHRPLSVVSATKSTSLPRTHGLFDSIVNEVASEYDELEYQHLQVDNVAKLLVTHPEEFDVIIAPNAEGDILSDIGAGTVGGLGLAPSGCYGENEAYFEPIHGTAPDIVGEGIINPTAMMLTASMMLEYLDFDDAAERLEDAIREVYVAGEPLTPDQGGSASTMDMMDAVRNNLDI